MWLQRGLVHKIEEYIVISIERPGAIDIVLVKVGSAKKRCCSL